MVSVSMILLLYSLILILNAILAHAQCSDSVRYGKLVICMTVSDMENYGIESLTCQLFPAVNT